AGSTRSLHELLLQGLPFVLGPLTLCNVAGDNQDARDLAPLITDQPTGDAQGHAMPSLGLNVNVYIRKYTTWSMCQELPGGRRDSRGGADVRKGCTQQRRFIAFHQLSGSAVHPDNPAGDIHQE